MKGFKTGVLLLLVLSLALAGGCAKKPAPDTGGQTTATGPGTTGAGTGSGFQESVVTDGAQPSTAAGAVTGLQRIHFEFDQYVLSAQAKEILAQNAAYLQANPGVRVVIEGHCDERGSDEYNLALGEKRALTTKSYLVALGVAPARLDVISYGEERPLDPASDEVAWAKNRRAEFVSR